MNYFHALIDRFAAFAKREQEKRDEEARQLADVMVRNSEYRETCDAPREG